MLAACLIEISEPLGISVPSLAKVISRLLLTNGLSIFVLNTLAKVYGKRSSYTLSILTLLLSSIWGGLATSYSSFKGGRKFVVLGWHHMKFRSSARLVTWIFVSERGARLAFWNYAQLQA